MIKALVIGGTGMLGHKLVQRLAEAFIVFSTVRGTYESVTKYQIFHPHRTIELVDVTALADLERAIAAAEPDVVINCAGVVKQALGARDAINTLEINSILPHRLHQLSRLYGFRLVLISTDCVFRGDRGHYSEADTPDASDLYGRSKVLGEIDAGNTITIRTSFVGRELATSHGLIEWFLSSRQRTVNGYSRAVFSGFPTIAFADIIRDLLQLWPDLCGIYHVSSDPIDKYSLLCRVNEAFNAEIEVKPDDSLAVDRSLDSSRFRRITGFAPTSWKQMIERMAIDPTPYDEWRK